MRHIAKVNRNGHRSPLHQLICQYPQANPTTLEKIPAIGDKPWSPPPTQTRIEIDRATAIEKAKKRSQPTFRVFTDGSGIDGNAGASAVLFRDDHEVKTLRYQLGPLTEHTVYEAEAVAATMGLYLLKTETPSRLPAQEYVEIGIDNHAVIRAKHDENPHSGSHLLRHIREQADAVKAKMYKPRKLRMVWIPGHEDILGNERADEEAKDAAHGNESMPKDLPKYLRKKPLPRNKSAVAQAFDKDIKLRWRQECESSHRFERLMAIDNTMPSNKFLKYNKACNRAQTSMMMQLRTARIGLNRHLYQLSLTDKPTCPHCPHEEETVRHFLIECPYYWKARQPIRLLLRRDFHKMTAWLANTKSRQLVLNYIANTKRFEPKYSSKLLSMKIPMEKERNDKRKGKEKETETESDATAWA
jgi:ribonuclease HI